MIISPCISICKTDPKTGYCYGCGRTVDEKKIWKLLDTSDQWKSDNLKIINPINDKALEVTEDGQPLIRDDAIGEIRMKDLEKEAIIRTLRFYNNNRRKTAKSLGVSERTLYRKIEDYKLEPKIKKN